MTTGHACEVRSRLCAFQKHTQARRIEELRNDVARLEYSLTAATSEYERIAAINQQVCCVTVLRCIVWCVGLRVYE